jgi:preprotein translocase subunit SecG
MTKYVFIALALVCIVIVTVVVIQRHHQDGQIPDLDAAAVETGKNLHPPKLTP